MSNAAFPYALSCLDVPWCPLCCVCGTRNHRQMPLRKMDLAFLMILWPLAIFSLLLTHEGNRLNLSIFIEICRKKIVLICYFPLLPGVSSITPKRTIWLQTDLIKTERVTI